MVGEDTSTRSVGSQDLNALLHDLKPSDDAEAARLAEIGALLGSEMTDESADAVNAPSEWSVHKRLLPVRTTRLVESLPAWAAGLQPERTIGPIKDSLGRDTWFDLFRRVAQVRFVRVAGGAPFLSLPVRQFALALLGAPTAEVRAEAGSLWLQTRLLTAEAPAGVYSGLRIAGGRLRFSAPITLSGDEVVVPPGVTCEAEIDLAPPVPPEGAGPGEDVRAAEANLPRRAALRIFAAAATLAPADAPSLRLYGQELTFAPAAGPVRYLPALNRAAIPLAADAADFVVGEVRSEAFRPEGQAPVLGAAWAIPAAPIAPAELGEAEGVGALQIELGPGLRARWSGQPRTVPLGATRWLLDTARLAASAPAVLASTSLEAPRPPASLGRVRLRLDAAAPFPLDVLAQAAGSEAVVVTARVEASFPQPVDVRGDPVSVVAPAAQVLRLHTSAGQQVWATANALEPIAGPLAFALRNAVFRVSTPTSLVFAMALENAAAPAGAVAIGYNVQGFLAALPDPYAANRPDLARQRGGRLTSLLRWRAAETALDFILPPGLAPSLAQPDLTVAAQPRRVERDRRSASPVGLTAMVREPGGEEMASAVRAVGDVLDFETKPRLILLDVSTNVSQFGVALRPPRGREATFAATGASTPLQPLAVRRLELVADGRAMALVTLPAVQWEPVECEATGDDPTLPPRLRFDNSGVPTTVDVPSVRLVPVTPEAALDAVTGAFAAEEAIPPARARFTLPFGIVAQAELRRPGPGRGATVGETRPTAPDGLKGGRQLTLRAVDPSLPSGQTPALPGFAAQLPLARPGLRSVLGSSATEIFNTYLGVSSPNALAPVTRIDLSGFGESLFSAWSNPREELPQVSKAEFNVLVGRTAYEVVQVKTFKLPFCTPCVKTITFTRRSNGSVYRQESDWTPLGDGRFALPPAWGVVTHPGVVRRITNVANIRETGRRITHGGIAFAEVRYDGDVELEGSTAGLVPVRGQVGFLQITATPLTPAAYAALIAAEGSLCGPMDATVGVGGGPVRMRVHRHGVGVADAATGPEFAMTAWGGLVFPGGGDWSTLRAEDPDGAPEPVPASEGLPIVRAGPAGGPSVGPYRFADPADLARPTTPDRDYGILHATGTQRAFFRRPRVEPSALDRIVGEERPALADPYVLATAIGLFPRQADCIPLPSGIWAFAVGPDGNYRLEIPGGPTFPAGVGRRTMRQAGSVRSDLDYSASQVTYALDTALPVPWRFALTDAKRVMNHAAMGDLMTLGIDIAAEAGKPTDFRDPQLRMGGALEIVQDVLTILEDLGIPGVFRTVMTNAWSLNATLKVPITKQNGDDFTIPPVKPPPPAPPVNFALIFSDFGIEAENIIAPEADSCTLQIGGSPMFGTSIYGLYVVVIVKFKLKVGTDVGTVYSLLIGIGLAYKVEVGKWELKGLLAITFMAVFGDTVCGYAIGFLVKVSLDLSPVFCVEVSLEGKAARLTVHPGLPDETVFSVSKLVFAVEVSLVLVLSISFEVETKQVTVLRGPLTKDALPDAL